MFRFTEISGPHCTTLKSESSGKVDFGSKWFV
jgi:hypothetical protein